MPLILKNGVEITPNLSQISDGRFKMCVIAQLERSRYLSQSKCERRRPNYLSSTRISENKRCIRPMKPEQY